MPKTLGLRGKMLIFTFGIVAALIGLSLQTIHHFVAGQVQHRVGEDLAETLSVFEASMQERARWLRAQCTVVAEDPRFTATLDIQSPDPAYLRRTVLREARRFQSMIGCDLFLVTDREGRVLTRLEVSASAGGDLSGQPTVARALEGAQAAGPWPRAGRHYRAATVPIREAGAVLGTLSVGMEGEGDVAPFLEDLALAAGDAQVRGRFLSADREDAMLLAQEVLHRFGGDLAAVTDGAGTAIGMARREIAFGEDLSASPRVREALDGYPGAGMQVDRDRIVQMVVVPVWSQGEVIGSLGMGFGIDDRLARGLREMTHSDVSFVLDGRVVASTWPGTAREDLAQALAALGRPHADRADAFRMAVEGETYLSLFGPLEDLGGEAMGGYLIQVSFDKAIGFLTTVERVLLGIGVGVLLAAALVSFAGVTRIIRPVKALVEGTRRLASGDLSHRIAVTSRDEIGELAASFNEMSGSLSKSQDALAESERRYRDLFDNAQDVVYTTDLEMRLTSLNRAAQDLWGYPAGDLLGRSFYDLLAPEDAQRLREAEGRRSSDVPWPVAEVDILRRDGERTALEIVSRWIMEQGRPVGTHGIGRDITQRKEREEATSRFREQLHQAEKLRALGEMAAGVAHNFNNLLTGVVGYAEILKMRDDIPDAVQANARKILESAWQCSAIVRRIQAFGRPIDATQTKRIHLNQVVRDTVDITHPKWKSAAEREGRTVQVALELGEIPPVQSLVSAWEEILSNLIFNAVDAMPEGGAITLSTRREGEEVCVAVSDTGTGMDEETRRRVFEPFFTTKGPERGTGLGLSTVWGLVKGQRGRIEIESAPDEGTTFSIYVPAAAAADAEAEGPERGRKVAGLCILVIDDEAAVRDFLPEMLTGHSVDTAASGAEGLEMSRQKAYDLVITDWVMTGMSGLDVAERVKRRSPQTVVALMTGWEYRGSAVERSSAVDLTFSKPFDAEKLNRALQEAIRRR